MAKIRVRVTANRTLTGHDGVLYRAGDEFDVNDDDTVAQWLGAGTVTKVPARKRGTRADAGRTPRARAR